MAFQSTGKIVFTVVASDNRWRVGRLNVNGSLDTSFGVDGYWTGIDGSALDLAVDAADNVLVVGQDRRVTSSSSDGTLMRLTPAGVTAKDFGSEGMTQCGCAYTQVEIYQNKWIYVAGQAPSPVTDDSYVVVNRYRIDGTSDYSYGFDGASGRELPGVPGDVPLSLTVDAEGRPVLTAHTEAAWGVNTQFFRMTTIGALDSSFDVPHREGQTGAFGAVVLPDGVSAAYGLAYETPELTNGFVKGFAPATGQAFAGLGAQGKVGKALALAGNKLYLAYAEGSSFGLVRGEFARNNDYPEVIADTVANPDDPEDPLPWTFTSTLDLKVGGMQATPAGQLVLFGSNSAGDWAITRVGGPAATKADVSLSASTCFLIFARTPWTVTVKATASDGSAVNGPVTIKDAGVVVGTGTMTNGTANVTMTPIAKQMWFLGWHPLVVSYGGSATTNPATASTGVLVFDLFWWAF